MILCLSPSACERRPVIPKERIQSPEARLRGEKGFGKYCALCHGAKGDGKGVRKSGLIGHPADFTQPGWKKNATPELVYSTIRDGKSGTFMPSFRALREEEILDLTAFVLSIAEVGP